MYNRRFISQPTQSREITSMEIMLNWIKYSAYRINTIGGFICIPCYQLLFGAVPTEIIDEFYQPEIIFRHFVAEIEDRESNVKCAKCKNKLPIISHCIKYSAYLLPQIGNESYLCVAFYRAL